MAIISRDDFTVPNFLTVLRIVAALFAAVLFITQREEGIAALMCIGAGILDYFDGWYARKYHQTSKLGAHLDPFADKILISVIFIFLALELHWSWFSLFVSIILLREMTITVYRRIIRKKYGRFIKANIFGKIKTTVQSIVGDAMLFYIFVIEADPSSHSVVIFISMLITLFVTVDSGIRYILPSCSDGKKKSLTERIYQWILGLGESKV
ncbi:MAG TPA: CDP-diacylglycerol--glycerol-3-phosphate 3-phosphatidyltransferase [Candidatus Krumholzibacteriaceae bacterium]|nr:CDP-diacylglycerol--glycerol-3-phosphate 3-phosphatidyltransferase [Candidatus Krumholzibacteriaceae bacterium]